VADQTARYALAGLIAGAVVKQSDTSTYWEVIDAAHLSSAAGWSAAQQLEYIDLSAELEVTQGSSITSTLTYTLRVLNDVNHGGEGVPKSANPEYPGPAEILTTSSLASKAQAEAGSDNATVMTPLRTAEAIAALGKNAVFTDTDGSGHTYRIQVAGGVIQLVQLS
jgi:hypothetical protein